MLIHIATDSTADLPLKYINQHRIAVIPLNLHFGEDVLKDGEEIWAEEYYRRLTMEAFPPFTSQPSPEEFQDFYRKIAGPDDIIISVHISGRLSDTVKSARLAAEKLKNERKVVVVDSETVSMALGLMVLEVAKTLEKEKELGRVLDRIAWIKKNLTVFFTVESLEHLSRTGRLGDFSAEVGNYLHIKPILSIENGLVVPVDKVRGNLGRIHRRLLQLARERLGSARAKIIILHGDALEEAKKMEEVSREFFMETEITISTIGPVVGVHTGPRALGLVALPLP